MIIDALNRYYKILVQEPDKDVPLQDYCKASVSFALNLSPDGEILDIIDLRRSSKGNKLIPIEMEVPEQVKRSSGIAPNLMCDNSTYVLGIDAKGNRERAIEAFMAFRELHKRVLEEVNSDPGVKALLQFLDKWEPKKTSSHPKLSNYLEDLCTGGNIVFKLDGETGYIHQYSAVRNAWEKYCSGSEDEIISQCLVTGKMGPIARLHQSIKGVKDAQSSGASLISFNLEAFKSYGKDQSYNAPVSKSAAFAYTTILNYMLNNPKQRIQIGDATTIFWAECIGGIYEDLMMELFSPTYENNDKDEKRQDNFMRHDSVTVQLVRDILIRIREGKQISDAMTNINPDVRFYVLGLSPNASRISIRFWHADRFGVFVERIGQHYRDMEIVRHDKEPEFIPVYRILNETVPKKGKEKKIPPLFGGAVMRSILMGTCYPQTLYTSMLLRIRADQYVNYVRAAVIKACLLRNARIQGNKEKEVILTMSLNEQNTNTAYRLGRLFALLEKAQQDANPNLNTTIKDRYFGSASATPRAVFPILLRLVQYHIAKSDYGFVVDKKIEDIMDGLDGFPSYLNLEEQGLFVLGYYHQRHALYQKN